jgi:hypothetical protein
MLALLLLLLLLALLLLLLLLLLIGTLRGGGSGLKHPNAALARSAEATCVSNSTSRAANFSSFAS